MESDRRNIFLEKSYAQYGRETSPGTFVPSKLNISLDHQSKVLYSLFRRLPSWGLTLDKS